MLQVVEYSLTVYYTREFAASTADTLTFIDQVTRCNYPARLVQVIAETNQGYIHSGVPLRCVLHCALLSEVIARTLPARWRL